MIRRMMFTLTIILLMSPGVLIYSKGQKEDTVWESPADRYIDAYKAYLDEETPIKPNGIKHFVWFARDREAIQDHPFLEHSQFKGAQIMYSWKQLEPEKGIYDFTLIREDYLYLQSHGKNLFVQLQDATFSPLRKGMPAYLLQEEYDGGTIEQFEEGEHIGWVAKRWNPKVRERFSLLLLALGQEFDGKIEGINLQESAIGVSSEHDPTFSPENYVVGLKANMLAMKRAFPQSATLQYANFMPGEWLPWEDEGYLHSIYEYGEEIGVGLGGPDLMVRRKGQLNHTLAMMHESVYTVPLGIAVQDGNYVGTTGSDSNYDKAVSAGNNNRENIVPMLHGFAKNFLRVDYMFWVNQEPYFTEDVLPSFAN